VERLSPTCRAAEMTLETTLPRGVEGSLADSLDFIELSVAMEERFGIVIDEAENSPTTFSPSIPCPASSSRR
jgi:acyl carrier protein